MGQGGPQKQNILITSYMYFDIKINRITILEIFFCEKWHSLANNPEIYTKNQSQVDCYLMINLSPIDTFNISAEWASLYD